MNARLRAWMEDLGDQFWLRPALIVLFSVVLALTTIWFGHSTSVGRALSKSAWIYSGGAEGARSLLSTVASSSIGVASTVFSITIAALSLASGQMGPRLLRNFVRDSRNQIVLGIFLGTFVYALVVLRTIRTAQEGDAFVPGIAISGAIGLALVCVGTLTWFVHHIATSINVETVVDAVHRDLCRSVLVHTLNAPDMASPSMASPCDAICGEAIGLARSGYLQAIDTDRLADWAIAAGTSVYLLVRPGDYVPFGAPVARVMLPGEAAHAALDRSLTFGRRPAALQDLEFSIRQLVEVAVRALSPGINDPMTAGSVLEHFGDVLCRVAPRHLPQGAVIRGGQVVVRHPVIDYEGLCDGMFHMIRQNAAGSVFVLIRTLEVFTRVAEVEGRPDRRAALRRHADLVLADAAETMGDKAGRANLEDRYRAFQAVLDRTIAARMSHRG